MYLAEDTKLNRKVALKFLPGYVNDDREVQQRFRNEAQAAAALSHPNIAQIYAIEEVEGALFIVMEYVRGTELKELVSGGNLSPDKKQHIALQIARGLQAAHRKGIIHRDVKSGNIMIDEEGSVKIMDFGLARIRGSAHITRTGATLGTTAYMAPEQILGEEADERSDIWSFGVVLYELLTGKLPFQGIYDQAVSYAILDEEPETVSKASGDIPAHIEAVVNRCLEKSPEQRYSSFDEVIADFSDTGFQYKSKNGIQRYRGLKSKLSYLYISVPLILILLLFLIPSPMDNLREWFASNELPEEIRLGVLPFRNVGADSANQVLLDGLYETLTSSFRNIGRSQQSLWVLPSADIRDQNINSAREAKEKLNATLVVDGSVQPFGNDKIRLTLNLWDAVKLKRINANIIDADTNDFVSLHDKTVRNFSEMLGRELNPQLVEQINRGGTTEPEAMKYYLSGTGYLAEYQNEEELNLAIQQFQKAIDKDSAYALAYAGLGESYWRKYELLKDTAFVSDARKALNKALLINDDLAHVKLTMGILYRGTGEYDKAVIQFQNALGTDPGNDTVFRELARTYEVQGEHEKAEEAFQEAIRQKPEYWASYNQLGVFYLFRGRYEDAIAQFDQVVDLAPDNYRGYLNLGNSYFFNEEPEKAREMYEKSMSIKQTYPAASNLGTIYYGEDNFEQAARNYKLALTFNPNDHKLWGNLGSAHYWSTRDREKANEFYRTAIEKAENSLQVNPNNVRTLRSLGGYHAEIGDSVRAIEYLGKAVSKGLKDLSVTDLFMIGAAYEKLKDRSKALVWIERAVKEGYPISDITGQPELRELVKDPKFQNMVEKYRQ